MPGLAHFDPLPFLSISPLCSSFLIVHPKLFTIGEESREKLPAANGEQLCAARKIFCDHP